MRKVISLILVLCVAVVLLCSCDLPEPAAATGTEADMQAQKAVTESLTQRQRTPTDIDYSLERYNLIRRAYWVNGQREKANMVICPVEKPLGYIVLFAGNAVVGNFVVDGKVTSLNSYLTPSYENDSMYSSNGGYAFYTIETADVDGSYGENDTGIFFFTPDGRYIEWTGEYLYSDIPFIVNNPVVTYQEAN
jgi:hypothetical protein